MYRYIYSINLLLIFIDNIFINVKGRYIKREIVMYKFYFFFKLFI